MRALRALLFTSATSLAACGGILGFGDDDDEPIVPPSSPPDSSVGIVTEGGPDPSADAADDVTGVVTGDAGIDAPDNTPVDAGPAILVLARFEGNGGVLGADGADVADNMLASKTDAINGTSARTLANRPALLGWTFALQPTVFVTFSLRIFTLPSAPGGELARVTGSSAAVSIVIGKTGTFALRTGSADVLGATMSVDASYRVGIEISEAAGTARAGFVPLGGKLTSPISAPWVPGKIDALQIGTNNAALAYAIDDVVVSTASFQ